MPEDHDAEYEKRVLADPRMRALLEATQAALVMSHNPGAQAELVPPEHVEEAMLSLAAPGMAALGSFADVPAVQDAFIRVATIAFHVGVCLARREDRA